jgi:tRNA(adenine34) deaminase
MGSVLGHAEINAIHDAEKKLKNWRLDGCDIYVTLDPCPMCASAIKQARISNVYSALNNSDFNNEKILNLIFNKDTCNSSVNFVSNLDSERSKKLLNSFFKKQRIL